MSEVPSTTTDPADSRALWSLVSAHLDRTSITERSFARQAGLKHQTLNAWKHRELRQLPHRESLTQLASALGLPYLEVLTAALQDTGYVDSPTSTMSRDPTADLDEHSRRVVLELVGLLARNATTAPAAP